MTEPTTAADLDALWANLWDDLRHNATGKPTGEAIIERHRPAIEAEARQQDASALREAQPGDFEALHHAVTDPVTEWGPAEPSGWAYVNELLMVKRAPALVALLDAALQEAADLERRRTVERITDRLSNARVYDTTEERYWLDVDVLAILDALASEVGATVMTDPTTCPEEGLHHHQVASGMSIQFQPGHLMETVPAEYRPVAVPGAVGEPRTKAGRAVLDTYGTDDTLRGGVNRADLRHFILAIESEVGGAVGEREELDVERLARALFAGDPKWHGSWADLLNEDMEIFRDRARDIAASYARLSVNEGGVARTEAER